MILYFLFSVMCTQFIARTHLIFTGGKDGKIKQWDADKFELIVTLQVTLTIYNSVAYDGIRL